MRTHPFEDTMRIVASFRQHLSIYNARPKQVHPSLSKMINKCANPLFYHTKPCVALWARMDEFNKHVGEIQYEISQLGKRESLEDPDAYLDQRSKDCDDYDQSGTDECRVFD